MLIYNILQYTNLLLNKSVIIIVNYTNYTIEWYSNGLKDKDTFVNALTNLYSVIPCIYTSMELFSK